MDVPNGQREWLETSASGSFAFGCVDRRLRRKYHALLTVREPPRGTAWNVLAEVRERVHRRGHETLLADVLSEGTPEAVLTTFEPSPTQHVYRADDVIIARSLSLGPNDQLAITYVVRSAEAVVLTLEPLLRCRDLHALTFENPYLDGAVHARGDAFWMAPYAEMPAVVFRFVGAEAHFVPAGRWLADVDYPWEAARGYPAREHLFSPGHFQLTLPAGAPCTLTVALDRIAPAIEAPQRPREIRGLAAKLARATHAYFARTRSGAPTVIAGYPWLGRETRDTLIALPGLVLATGDVQRGVDVLEELLTARVDGLLCTRPPAAEEPPTGSPEASLLFARAVQWLGAQAGADKVARFMPAVCELLEALAEGDQDTRLDAGMGVWTRPGTPPRTWMNAVVDGVPVTPRAGYAIELDALAYNAAQFASTWADAHRGTFARAFRARLRTAEADFVRRYWDDARGYLADGHDGARPVDALRPNQLFAIGLPHRAITGTMARAALEAVTRTLLVPPGLRTLAPHELDYHGACGSDQRGRDLSYHRGTVWPWLIGIYADAVLLVHGRAALEGALSTTFAFFAHALEHDGCIGHVSEVFSGDAPHLADGAPAHAMGLAELYRALSLLTGRTG